MPGDAAAMDTAAEAAAEALRTTMRLLA